MSTELGKLEDTGSRGISLDVTRYCGGNGCCYQLTGEMEEGGFGYVQVTRDDIKNLLEMIEEAE